MCRLNPVDVTIGICTWNRADLLDQTLAQIGRLQVPSDLRWEVLVVNNASTDHTPEVLRRHEQALPLRHFLESEQGKSHALNTATAESRGELILWTDDDVLPHPMWLAEITAAAQAHPEYSFFGGPIEPWFSRPAPRWLTDQWELVASAYATRDLGWHAFDFTADKLPFGANLAIRRSAQLRFQYDPRLGRVGPSEVRGEEMQMLAEMLAAGERGRWVPTARVQHFIPPERMNVDYLIRFFHGIGQTMCRRDALRGRTITLTDIRRKRRHALRGLVASTVRRAIPLWPSGSWLKKRLAAARDQGYCDAAWSILNQGRSAQAA